jgi:hypothetical protein
MTVLTHRAETCNPYKLTALIKVLWAITHVVVIVIRRFGGLEAYEELPTLQDDLYAFHRPECWWKKRYEKSECGIFFF